MPSHVSQSNTDAVEIWILLDENLGCHRLQQLQAGQGGGTRYVRAEKKAGGQRGETAPLGIPPQLDFYLKPSETCFRGDLTGAGSDWVATKRAPQSVVELL